MSSVHKFGRLLNVNKIDMYVRYCGIFINKMEKFAKWEFNKKSYLNIAYLYFAVDEQLEMSAN